MRRPLATNLATALATALALATLLVSTDALADRVATLHARGTASDADRLTVYQATEAAEHALGHATATEAEVLQGEGAAGDTIGTSKGLVAVGQVTSSDWVVEATVSTPTGASTRVELKACQVSSGRVETLARDVDPAADLSAQIKEMLALMLRPQGIGDDPLPWEHKGDAKAAPPPTPAPPPPVAPPDVPAPKYGEGGSVALGAGGGALDLLARPSGAQGARGVGSWFIDVLVAVPPVPRLEVGGRVGSLFGPAGAGHGEFVARYMLPLGGRFAFGGMVMAGAFLETGGAQEVRVLFGLSPVLALTVTKHLELDLDAGALKVAPGKDGALVFAGVEGALKLRF